MAGGGLQQASHVQRRHGRRDMTAVRWQRGCGWRCGLRRRTPGLQGCEAQPGSSQAKQATAIGQGGNRISTAPPKLVANIVLKSDSNSHRSSIQCTQHTPNPGTHAQSTSGLSLVDRRALLPRRRYAHLHGCPRVPPRLASLAVAAAAEPYAQPRHMLEPRAQPCHTPAKAPCHDRLGPTGERKGRKEK